MVRVFLHSVFPKLLGASVSSAKGVNYLYSCVAFVTGADADLEHVRAPSDPEAEQEQHGSSAAAQAPANFAYEANPVAAVQQEPVIMSNGNATLSGNDSMESPDVSLVEPPANHQPQVRPSHEAVTLRLAPAEW